MPIREFSFQLLANLGFAIVPVHLKSSLRDVFYLTLFDRATKGKMMIDNNYHTVAGHRPSQKKKPDEISTGFLINVAALSLKKHFSQELSASGYQISTEQYAVLSQLWSEDDIYQSDLGKRVFKDRHNISRIIKSLERKTLVIKKADENDARLARCVLTEKGRALRGPLRRISTRVLNHAFQEMGEEEIRKLNKTLIHLLRNLGEDLFPPETAE